HGNPRANTPGAKHHFREPVVLTEPVHCPISEPLDRWKRVYADQPCETSSGPYRQHRYNKIHIPSSPLEHFSTGESYPRVTQLNETQANSGRRNLCFRRDFPTLVTPTLGEQTPQDATLLAQDRYSPAAAPTPGTHSHRSAPESG